MAGRAAHQSPSEPPASPARARCARRAGAGGARGVWLPPTTTRIPRRARGARAQALTAPLHAPHGKGVPCPTPNHHRHVRHEREAWAGQVRVGRTARGYHPRPRGSRTEPSTPMCGTTSRSMRGARRGGPASTPTGTHGTRARRAHTPREGGSAVQPVAPTLGPQGERVTHAPVRRGARDARGRELSFLEFCPPFW